MIPLRKDVKQSDKWDLTSLFKTDEEWELIDRVFKFYNKKNKKFHPVECIIYNDISNVNVIYKTKQFTLPNLDKLTAELSLSDKNKNNK